MALDSELSEGDLYVLILGSAQQVVTCLRVWILTRPIRRGYNSCRVGKCASTCCNEREVLGVTGLLLDFYVNQLSWHSWRFNNLFYIHYKLINGVKFDLYYLYCLHGVAPPQIVNSNLSNMNQT